VDLISGLAARYCIRQDARGFIELWGLVLVLAGAATATRATWWRGTLACAILLTGALAAAIFWACAASAPASLGTVAANPYGRNLDAMICVSSHAVETIDEWISIVAAFVVAIGLIALGIFRFRKLPARGFAFAAGAVLLLFAAANGGLLLVGLSWCHSSRLF